MYHATCYSVMIVSPSDVTVERATVRQILIDWNSVNSEYYGIVLQPLGWETSTFSEIGRHPQDVINKQVLGRADLVIGIFWTKVGTETKEYPSGSIEEISRHVSAGKPACLYFSKVPVAIESVDHDQFEKLQKYKASIRTQGYYKEFSDSSEFTKIFQNDISRFVNERLAERGSVEGKAVKQEVNDAVTQEQAILANLNQDAQMLLVEIANGHGELSRVQLLSGLLVQTNGKAFNGRNERESAELEEAIEQLERNGLIKAGNFKREIFRMSAVGFRVAELVQPSW